MSALINAPARAGEALWGSDQEAEDPANLWSMRIRSKAVVPPGMAHCEHCIALVVGPRVPASGREESFC